MSFPRYPAYKPSGVAWLGEVPEHWEVIALKHGYEVTLGKMLQPEAASDDDVLLPYLRAANIHWHGVDDSDIKTMWFSKRDRKNLRLQAGDLLVSEGGDVGRSALWKSEIGECYFQNSLNRVRSRNANLTSFLRYWMSTMKDKGFIDVLCNKSTIAHFTAEKVGAVPVPLPSLYEQQAIATFLDRETAKIDALIAEQQRLIELLQEKRQAVISHAVTKGLNPDAPMKDSGVEWLGEVPEHWELKQVRHLLRSLSQGSSPSCLPDPAQVDEYGVLKVSCVNGIAFLPGENKALPAESSPDLASLIQKGDVLMSRGNTRELVGLAALVTESSDRLMASDLIFILRVRPEVVDPGFLVWSLRSGRTRSQLEPKTVGTSASMQKINQSMIKEIFLAIPPLAEQLLILEDIREKVQETEECIGSSREANTLLQERRSALISAAVTGQIDVRGLVSEVEP